MSISESILLTIKYSVCTYEMNFSVVLPTTLFLNTECLLCNPITLSIYQTIINAWPLILL